jgi:hypothetical protein
MLTGRQKVGSPSAPAGATKRSGQKPAVCTPVVEVATSDLITICPWALLELAHWCQGQLQANGGTAPCPDPCPTLYPPRLTNPPIAAIPQWNSLPPKQREELLRILARMLTEQLERNPVAGEANHELR